MGYVLVAVSGAAAYMLRDSSLFWPAVANTGVLFVTLSMIKDSGSPFIEGWGDRIVTTLSMLTALGGIALLVTAFVLR